MNRAESMLAVLRKHPGDWWPRNIIFAQAGGFFLTNNAASELRVRGYDVQHKVIKGKHYYRLIQDCSAETGSSPVTPTDIPSSVISAEQLVLGTA